MQKSISKKKALELAEKNKNDENFSIIDIRTPEEFAGGAMENAVNIDFYEPDFSEKLEKLDKQKTYLIYCRSGNRSKSALEIMEELGFENVYEIDEGFLG